MKIPRLFVLPALSLLVVSLSNPSTLFAADPAFDQWAENFATGWVRANPTASTFQQYLPAAEQDALDRQLTPITKEYRAGRVAAAKAGLAELAKFDRSKFDAQQRTSANVIEWSLNSVVNAEPFADYSFVFNQFQGLHVNIVNFLTQAHPIRNKRDIENYLARLALVGGQIDEGVAQAKDAAARGFLMPDFITKSVLGQFERFLGGSVMQNRFVASLDERAAKLKDVTADERAAFVAAAAKITEGSIIPAFQRAQAMLQEQLPHTTDHAGLCWLPGGDKAYAAALRRNTTTDLTAEQIHALGLSEVARIEQEMEGYFHQLGYTTGTIEERFQKLEDDQQPKGRRSAAARCSRASSRSCATPSSAPSWCLTLRPRRPSSCSASRLSRKRPPPPTVLRPATGRLAARHVLCTAAGPEVRNRDDAHAGLPRGRPGPPLPDRAATRDGQPAALPARRRVWRRLGLRRGLGALRRAARGREQLV